MDINLKFCFVLACTQSLLLLNGCGGARADTKAEEPPAAKVVGDVDVTLFSVDHPEQFPLATATEHAAVPELVVTGAVSPDVSRNVPVVSLASGRVVGIHARLGDTVESLVLAGRAGLRIDQVPVAMRSRRGGQPSQSALRSTIYLARALLVLALAVVHTTQSGETT